MEYRLLGRSGLKVPVLCFGVATFGGGNEFFRAWGATDVEEAKRLVGLCLDAGVNFFDTADGYSDGLSEQILGKAIEGKRHDVLLSTKSYFPMGEGPNDRGSSRYHILDAVEGSLKRLGTDYIDVYHMHGFDALTPVEETLDTLEHAGALGQGALHCVLEFFRLAFDEVAGGVGAVWVGPVCGVPGLLLAGRARVRVGADAARTRPGRRDAGVESAGLGTADRQDPARTAAAEDEPPAQDGRSGPGG